MCVFGVGRHRYESSRTTAIAACTAPLGIKLQRRHPDQRSALRGADGYAGPAKASVEGPAVAESSSQNPLFCRVPINSV